MLFETLENFIVGLSGMVRTNMVRKLYVESQPLGWSRKAKLHDGQNIDWTVDNTGSSQQGGVYGDLRLYWCSFGKCILVGIPELVLGRYFDSGKVSRIGDSKA